MYPFTVRTSTGLQYNTVSIYRVINGRKESQRRNRAWQAAAMTRVVRHAHALVTAGRQSRHLRGCATAMEALVLAGWMAAARNSAALADGYRVTSFCASEVPSVPSMRPFGPHGIDILHAQLSMCSSSCLAARYQHVSSGPEPRARAAAIQHGACDTG